MKYPELKTVGDIVNLIRSNAKSPNKELANHAQTLLGPRTRGSTTKLGLESIDPTLALLGAEADESRYVADGCDLHLIYSVALGGTVQAIKLRDAWEAGHVVKCRLGDHGPELYVDRDLEDLGEPCMKTSIIVGEFAGEPAVFTWHPGLPLPSLDFGLTEDTAVKLHRG